MDSHYSESELAMIELLEKHVNAELQGDLDTTMATMSDNPHLHNIPNMMGGNGYDGVRSFYKNHLVGKFFPPDVTMKRVSLTVGTTQIVDELVITFTHTTVIDWLLPEIAPTGKKVEVAVVVIAGVKDNKITHEHIYWDQASVLAQVGLLDPKNLPVCGSEGARKLLDPSVPNRTLKKRV
ncbi:MAG: ester cyclase [Nitrospira sp.]|nr:ester cyclase [Nitrospira sp.]